MASAAFTTAPCGVVEARLAAGSVVERPQAAAHYPVQVMRRQPGEPVRLFDDCTGEWLGRMADVGRKRATGQVEERLSESEIVPDLWLCAAPTTKGRVVREERGREAGSDRGGQSVQIQAVARSHKKKTP